MTTTIQKYQYVVYMLIHVDEEKERFEYIFDTDNIKSLVSNMNFWKKRDNVYKLDVKEYLPGMEFGSQKLVFSCNVVYDKPTKKLVSGLNPETDVVLNYKLQKVWPQKTLRVPMQLLKYSNKTIKLVTETKKNILKKMIQNIRK